MKQFGDTMRGIGAAEQYERETPDELFAELNREFGFDLDVCALPHNAKLPRFYTPEVDGLKQDWVGTCWMNPPYGRDAEKWIRKALEESRKGSTIVCLLPSRTDVRWFHDLVLPHAEVRFIRGRLYFKGMANNAPFPSLLAIFRPDSKEIN
jgi:phage N-6-adenine-methyltransferase